MYKTTNMWQRDPLIIKSEKLLEGLKEFELFCLGKLQISQEHFMTLNKQLSLGALMYVGRHRKSRDGFIWIDPQNNEHRLGPLEDLDVLNEGPGFHRTRTMALSGNEVVETQIISIPPFDKQMTKVRLKDGSEGIGPDYRMALRNAVLRQNLLKQFNKSKGFSFWTLFGGNA